MAKPIARFFFVCKIGVFLLLGYRMPAPDNTPAEMYRLMLKCWAYEADARPHFDEIHTVVDALINRE